jgi:hypothetical protein
MASERQIAANRQNALKSTGPRTSTGKQRALANAYRHGLSSQTDDGNIEAVESLVRRIAGDTRDPNLLRCSHDAARAHIDLARIRQVKREVFERVYRFGGLKPAPRFRSVRAEMRYVLSQPLDQPLRWPDRVDPLGPMPSEEAEREAEAVRRLLPELRKLNRYEARAYAIKVSALREVSLRMYGKDLTASDGVLQNEPNSVENQ